MRNAICMMLAVVCLLFCVGCGQSTVARTTKTIVFTDDLGRTVELPARIEKAAPSGAVAQMILVTLSPEKLCGLSSAPDAEVMDYLPKTLRELPELGQLYGSRGNFNLEALIASGAQVIIDMGQPKANIAQELDSVQAQTGLPVIFLDAELESLSGSYRTLGELFCVQERAQELAAYIDEALALCEEKRARLPEEARRTVAFCTGPSGLACNAAHSMQAEVIERVGGVNAVSVPEEALRNRSGGNEISMEQMYLFDPDVLVFSADGPCDTVANDPQWQALRAVRDRAYYEIPSLPYSWMGNPPSVNRVLGLYWLGNLLYPQTYDYDMVSVAQYFYKLFWHYELSRDEAQTLLHTVGER